MERRGTLQETGRGHGGHEPRKMRQLYEADERRRGREREDLGAGGLPSEFVPSSLGVPQSSG